MTIAIVPLTPQEIAARRDDLGAIFRAAFAMAPDEARAYLDNLSRHLRYPGFRLLAARERDGGALVGFAYGYASARGQWFHEAAREALGPELAAHWLADAFEFTEFAVQPAWQGRGIGGRLHDATLVGLPHRTAILSTRPGDTNARALYRKRGWVELRRDYRFPGIAQPYLLLGKDLR